MSRSLDSLIDVTKAVIDSKPWDHDPKCAPLVWRDEMFTDVQLRPLVIAVMCDDGVVRLHPPVARVLEEVASKLAKSGHEIVPWKPGTLHQECIDIMVRSSHHACILPAKNFLGSVLYCRWRRRYQTRCGSWGRAFHTSCRSACQQGESHIRLRILAA